jgi:aryl-alcohol dehydrogenase-like predicted oxidoreductase
LGDARAVSRVGLGTWGMFGIGADLNRVKRTIGAALDAGIDFIDTAPSYADGAAEEWLGGFLGTAKNRALVATKAFFHPAADAAIGYRGLGRASLLRSVEGSLKRLRSDRLALLFCHRPDPDVPLAETVQALGDLRRDGKIADWGVSRWSPALIAEANRMAPDFSLPPIAATQEPWNRLLDPAAAAIPARIAAAGTPAIGYSVMARGALTGRDFADRPNRDDRAAWQIGAADRQRIETLGDLARSRGLNPVSLLIADALSNGPCSGILTSASSPEQIGDIAAGMALGADPLFDSGLDAVFGRSSS